MLKNVADKRNALTTAALSIALFGGSAIANADHDRNFRGRRDADLDVTARIDYRHGQAQLKVRIDAEIEGRFLRDQYNVVLTIAPSHAGFGRGHVQPQTVIVPLGRPTDIDHDEIEFKQRVTIQLPRHLARFGNSLVVHAKLVSATSGRVLERDKSLVETDCQPIPRRPRHRGPRFGHAVIW